MNQQTYDLRIAVAREALSIREVVGLQDQLSQLLQTAQEAGAALKQITETTNALRAELKRAQQVIRMLRRAAQLLRRSYNARDLTELITNSIAVLDETEWVED